MANGVCTVEQQVAASACYDCLDDLEKKTAIVFLKAMAVEASGGDDLTNPNDLRQAAECLSCGGVGKLKTFAVLNAIALAGAMGADVPETAAELKAAIACWCGLGEDELSAMESLLDCKIAVEVGD